MIITIRQIEKPIFEEELISMVPPSGQPLGIMTYVLYQYHSTTFFSESTYNKVNSVFFATGTNHRIPQRAWTNEMANYAKMREDTVQRARKRVHFNFLGKALFVILFALILFIPFQVMRSMSFLKKEKAEQVLLTDTPKENDQYYGYFNEFASSGASIRMGWTWIKIVKIEGSDYQISIGKEVADKPAAEGTAPTGFEGRVYHVHVEKGTMIIFKSPDKSFDFTAMSKL
jgi:hypothetical protein